jgi:periplasmic mercuric ion binding protein
MNFRTLVVPVIVAAFAVSAIAETKVTLSEAHVCCGNCVTGAANAVKPVTGATAVANQETSSIAITATDAATAQKAMDALIAAGYFGKSSDAAIKVNAPTNAPDAKVATLQVSGVHLCCPRCVTAVKELLTKVPGVTGNTVAVRQTTFNVTGDFNAKQVFDEMHKAGLAGHVGAPATQPAK